MEKYEQFKQYCDFLHPNGKNYFACYGGNGAKPIQLHNTPADEKTYGELKRHNDNGADVYVAVQPSNGFKQEDVSAYRFLLSDWDAGRQNGDGDYYPIEVVAQKKNQIKAKWKRDIAAGTMLEPSLIVETRNGYQLYYLIDTSDAAFKDFATYKAITKAIARKLGSDKAVSNLNRVFRVPGLMWRKTKEGLSPFPARTVLLKPENIYTHQQIASCFPYDLSEQVRARTPASLGRSTATQGTYWICFEGKRPFEVSAFMENGQLHAACIYCGDPKGHDIVFSGRDANGETIYCNRCCKGGYAVDRLENTYWYQNQQNRLTVETNAQPGEDCPPDSSVQQNVPLYPLTEAGNAERLRYYYGDKLRYVCELNIWANYRGGKWNLLTGNEVARYYALKNARRIKDIEAQTIQDQEMKARYIKWARLSESNSKINSTLSIAQCLFPFQSYQQDFDNDTTLLNCKNGAVNLLTGELVEHSHTHMITQIIDINYNPDTQCPMWLKALDKYMLGNKEMVKYLQQISGICLLGHSERIFPVFYGLGKNGKSVFIDTLLGILGDYGWHAPESFLQQKKNPDPFVIANLKGKRFVCLSETQKTMVLDASLVKSMTGDSKLTGRFLYGQYFSFSPTHMAILTTQNLPTIKESSSGIWDRIQQVDWRYRISEAEEDKRFIDTLKPEYEGILNWMVQGALSYKTSAK